MVVWRPSVARMVYLHTGTMGVHHACLFSVRRRDVATPEARPRRKAPSLSYAYHRCSRTNWRAPGKIDSLCDTERPDRFVGGVVAVPDLARRDVSLQPFGQADVPLGVSP